MNRPRAPITAWANIYEYGHGVCIDKEAADNHPAVNLRVECVELREVGPDYDAELERRGFMRAIEMLRSKECRDDDERMHFGCGNERMDRNDLADYLEERNPWKK